MNPFDQACRFLLRLHGAALLAWLLRLSPAEFDFVGWLDTQQVPWPGHPERVCDTVAHLRVHGQGGLPWAVVVEFQIAPDELMFGRGLRYLGDIWEAFKPTEHRGDRFEVGLVVANLTGRGRASRNMRLPKTRLRTALQVGERNLATLSAKRVLRQIEAGEAPRAVLAWVPLFRGGGMAGIIPEWRRLAEQELDVERRRSLGLAQVFADATDCGDVWREGLKEWNMMESKTVNIWTEQARTEGTLQGQRGMLLRQLQRRFTKVPADLDQAIRACADSARLEAAGDVILTAASLADFRREAGL